ncbi:MAG: SMC-Scp complex subunit ScpB [Ruminococcaceae bacterium]|nr:SMC-Scp complex subunit ScpB [Oscillospiraceae bacterium]
MPTVHNSAETQELLGSVDDVKRAIEAILFAAGYPVKYEKLSEVIGLPQRDLRNLISLMAKEYKDRGIQLLLYPDTCQLTTKEVFAPYIREALGIKRGGNLSASSLEVLAVVAYNQPVTRSYVDIVRGVDSSYAVTSLLDKGLIEAVGRLDAPGRPMLYGTTDKFLRVFGLNSLADLPETEALDTAAAHAQENTSAEDATAESTISNEQDFTQEASDHHSEEKEDSL